MNFVVYCHIFQYIFIILVVITNVLNDFGDFLNNPLLLVLTLSSRKYLLLVFWTFQELRDSKKDKVRGHSSEISRRIQQAKVGHQEVNQLQMRPGGVVRKWDHATCARLRLERPLPSVFAWFDSV